MSCGYAYMSAMGLANTALRRGSGSAIGSTPHTSLLLRLLLSSHTTSIIGSRLSGSLLHLQMSASEWSAPLFFMVYSVGLGLTIGFAHMESVVLLKSDDAINGFLDKVLASRSSVLSGPKQSPHAD